MTPWTVARQAPLSMGFLRSRWAWKPLDVSDTPANYKALLPGVAGGESVVKNLPANPGDTRDLSLISGLGRSPGGGNGNPL